MKIAILSRGPRIYSTRRLREAAESRGHTIRVLDTLNFSILLEAENPDLFYRGKLIGAYDAMIPRIAPSITFFGTAIVRQFEQMGVYCLNSSQGIVFSRDKLRSLQILSKHDVGIPTTAFVRGRHDVYNAIERVGGAPVIIKLLEGTQGVGVILAETQKVAEAIIETLHSANQNVLIQKFVAESKGKDVRALVVGERVVAAMRRTAQGQEFRSNVHRGGFAEGIELDEEYERTAIRAAQVMGLRVAGVDMLEGADGPQITEVNSSPGLEGIESATGADVAGAIIDYMVERVSFPDVDIRQRLTVSRGYGVAEVNILENSSLLNKTIAECGLSEKHIAILTVKRGRSVIPNPKSDRVIELGDSLLCFGPLEEMRGLVVHRRRRRKKKSSTRSAPQDPEQ